MDLSGELYTPANQPASSQAADAAKQKKKRFSMAPAFGAVRELLGMSKKEKD